MPKAGYITSSELMEATGFSERRIQQFVKEGMPYEEQPQANGGRPSRYFDLEKCLNWMSARGIVTKNAKTISAAAVAETAASLPDGGEEKAKPKIDMTLAGQPGLIGALERIRLQEYNTAMLMINRTKQGASRDELSALERLHTKATTLLRQVEFAALEYRKSEGELIEFEPMVQAWEKIATGFKNAVLGLPSQAIPKLRGYLREPDKDLNAVVLLLDQCARDTLKALPDEMPIGSDTKDDSGGDT